MLQAPESSRVCSVAVLLVLFFIGENAYGNPTCTLDAQLSTSVPYNGAKFATIPGDCSLLGPMSEPVVITTDVTLSGESSGAGSLDTHFAKDAVVADGTKLTLENLRLRNVRLELAPFLALSAFKGATLNYTHVTMETDCLTLSAISESSPVNSARGRGYLFVPTYVSRTVTADSVNITCALPAIEAGPDGVLVRVGDSLELLNALVVSQLPVSADGSEGNWTVLVTANISISTAIWRRSNPLNISRGVTLQGDPRSTTVLDFQTATNLIYLAPGVIFNLNNLVLMNVGPLRGTLEVASILPCFSIPVWFFNFPRIPTAPQLNLTNVILMLPPSEYEYFNLWTLLLTTPIASISAGVAVLRATTPIIEVASSTKTTIIYSQLMGTGLNMWNLTLTSIRSHDLPYAITVLDNPNLLANFGSVPDLTWVAAYDLEDLMTILRIMQDTPPSMGIAISLLSNITIETAIWPVGGFNISKPLLLLGQTNLGFLTWIDFRRLPHFVHTIGCAPSMFYYAQGLQLLNLPNSLASGGSMGAGSGMSDVSLYLSNFAAGVRSCVGPLLFTNMTSMIVTYSEFKLIHAEVVKALGTSTSGTGTALASTFAFNLSNVVKDNINFLNVAGWGWQGSNVNITYKFPAEVTAMYTNNFDESYPPPDSGSDDGGGGLEGWQIALIVVGAVIFAIVITLAAFIAWRVSARKRPEDDAVKSGGTDKKSSSASGDHDHANGGTGRLGSSAMVGNGSRGSQAGSVVPGSPAVAKGSQAAAGTSDDSTVPQYDRPPLEVLNSMMASLTQEMDDRHLTILEVIGQGGFGVVYRALWKGLNVAVKTITFQDRVAGGEKAQHRAILEAAISSSLSHPNVVTTYSYDIKPLTVQGGFSSESPDSQNGSSNTGGMKIIDKRAVLDWKLYLVQEYCDGGSLRTAILKRKFFDTKKDEPRMEMIMDTCLELCGGLVHLHERNIIHGDLNPNNVLLKREASKKYGAVCKIADFGLSIKMSADQSHISNMRRGTPFYTCPQILARGNMTKAADIYSMGVMMWEMYHCCMSYRSLPSGFCARENFPNFPRKAPHDFARVVTACLENEPAQRPTFTQLRSELEAQLVALKQGGLHSGEEVLGPDTEGDAAHMAACQD